ncbi:MAG: T9SS type A sorting domain-containing protein, partial [Bacteroidia bacterium]|nr:T9SS type A sorting domain-containing protein [Bacteroidia bacterium]
YTWFLADPLPSVSISGETSVCSGSETVLEALTSGGVGFSKIRWEYEKEKDIWEFISESEDYVTITVSPTETTTYRAIYSRDGNGCGSAISDDFTITVNGLPTVNIASSAPDNKTCEGTMVTFTATPVNTGGMKVSYSWSYNGISIGSDQDFYTSDELIDGDMVWCTITVNNEACSTETRPISNKIVMSVESTPIAGTLAKTPDVMTVGAGTDVSAVLIPGSGGDGTDMLVFRTNVGTNWSEFAPYTSGANIGTTGRTAVEIRTRRWSNYCSPSSENIVSWTVEANPVLDNPGPQTACGSYTLPTITGTNLEDAKYYDNSQALGGTVITGPIKSSMMVWIYDVTVNGYSDEESFRVTINSLPVPPAVGTITQPTCSVSTGSVVLSGLPSGSWTVTGTSGSGNVTKTGSRSTTTITGLSAGTTYTFTVTIASGCTSLPSGNVVIIPQPQAPDAPVVESQSFCGSATEADLPQRNGSNTYKWYSTSTSRSSLSGSTRLSTGIYYVSQVSGGCESSRTGVNITINDLPASFRVTGGGTCCGGGPGLTVKLSGSTTGVDYQLCLNGSPVAGEIVSGTGSAISFTDQTLAGTYTVIAIKVSTGCQATMTGRAVISVSNPPAATSIVYSKSSSSNCSTSGSATVSYFSGTSGGRYSSSPSGLSINSSTGTVNFARSNPGIYTVTYSVHNTCGTAETTTQIRVTRCTKSGYISNDQGASPDLTIATSELKVYPNPSNGPVRFEFSTILDGRVTLDIINMQGQLIMRLFEGDAVAGEVRTVLFDGYLTAGTYIYRMTSADGVKNGKIIRM